MTDSTMWVKYLIRLTPNAPLLLGDRSGFGQFQETADFIPGSAVRGAIAGQLLQSCTHPDYLHDHASCPARAECPFWQLFGQDEPYFGNAYPGTFGPVWPYPATARTCKRYPGWPTTADEQHQSHGITDMLFADFAYNLVSDPQFPGRSFLQPDLNEVHWWPPHTREQQGICSAAGCGKSLQPATGYYAWQQNRTWPTKPLRVSQATHVGINRARSVAQDELLFTQESIQQDGEHAFFSRVAAQTAKGQALQQLLSGSHFVGRGRSRGHGEVRISIEAGGKFPSLGVRLLDFKHKAEDALAIYQKENGRVSKTLPGQLFSLTLHAPAIFQTAGLPFRIPDAHFLGLPPEVIFLRAWARSEQIGGWDSAAQQPRRTQQAVQAGSVFLYFAPDETVPLSQLTTHLETLEMEGIGLERERGYGEVMVSTPFHVAKAQL